MAKTDKSKSRKTIALNKKARHDYTILISMEAGLALLGWEVKSLREGRLQLKESYVLLKGAEAFLFGAHIAPLPWACAHVPTDPLRTRKLLLHKKEINKLLGGVQRKGYTVVPLAMYWKKGRAKLEIALALGKKNYDKRQSEKAKDWARQKAKIMRQSQK